MALHLRRLALDETSLEGQRSSIMMLYLTDDGLFITFIRHVIMHNTISYLLCTASQITFDHEPCILLVYMPALFE